MKLFFCIDDAQPCVRQCRACAETVAVNNAWEAEQRDRKERANDDEESASVGGSSHE